jgi:hypothetical protein
MEGITHLHDAIKELNNFYVGWENEHNGLFKYTTSAAS